MRIFPWTKFSRYTCFIWDKPGRHNHIYKFIFCTWLVLRKLLKILICFWICWLLNFPWIKFSRLVSLLYVRQTWKTQLHLEISLLHVTWSFQRKLLLLETLNEIFKVLLFCLHFYILIQVSVLHMPSLHWGTLIELLFQFPLTVL